MTVPGLCDGRIVRACFQSGVSEARRSLDVKAMFMQSNMRPCYYRHGYDIAVPLRARKLFHRLRKIAPRDREYFATFKASSGFAMVELKWKLFCGLVCPKKKKEYKAGSWDK